ncbi:hypothetical protein Q1J52_19190 [Pseudomonas lijiangensis]|uniref:hypothetical protein n=1 Tax=Pseudomonas syringae group TaxID=136849 RepID=UPI0019F229C9|nr:hypothetical protein [Pseudomonas cichorii]GFM68513.1 hypothetical protein PSCICJ_46310 [Pseudomonas cichorii]
MAARKRTLWDDLKFIVLAVIFLLIAVPGSFAVYRLFWTDATLCLAEGKVLSDEEHRQRFLESLVRFEVENSYLYKRHDGNDFLKTGVVYDAKYYDPVRIIKTSKNNDRSFEDNFGIKLLAPFREERRIDYPREPFVLVSYYDQRGGSSTFTDSRDVSIVKDTALLRDQVSFYDRVRGFGSRFYKVGFTFVNVECCGNDKYSQTEERYQQMKEQAWNNTLSSIFRGFATHTRVAVSSGCGEVLTGDNGIGTRSIIWINSGGE